MSTFVFDDYYFDHVSGEAVFRYHLEGGLSYVERVHFVVTKEYDSEVLDRALFLAFMLIGISYYKAFPSCKVQLFSREIDDWQAEFFSRVYQEGLSQFAFENGLTRDGLAEFTATGKHRLAVPYGGAGVIALQSGGKDSLLLATMLQEQNVDFSSLYISSGTKYPQVIDDIGRPVRLVQRHIDKVALQQAADAGGKNGHVPVTYIVLAISLVQVVLDGKNTVLAAIGHEGEEPHAWVDDLPVNHQWSKTWQAEQLFAEYIGRYVSPDIRVGSPLRQYSELKVAELFASRAWIKFGRSFSSCNVANYGQGVDNQQLGWCGRCPKCANAYLLFAPFVDAAELQDVFGGQDLFAIPDLVLTFKGLLGIDDVMKPFECIGEVDELRLAYHSALQNGYQPLPFDVPLSLFNADTTHPAQLWAVRLASE